MIRSALLAAPAAALCAAALAAPAAALAAPAAAQNGLDWFRTYNGPPGDQNDQASLVVVDDSGNAYFSGFSLGFSGPLITADVILLKYDPAGNLLWERRWDGGAQDQADAMILAPNGDVLIAARKDTFTSAFGEDIQLLRYAPDGTLVWQTTYDGPGGFNDRAYGLANGPQGSIYLAGRTGENAGGNYTRGLVARFDAQGTLVWDEHYIGPWLGDDLAVDLAVDATGRAYAACTSVSQTGLSDLALLCYDASGNLQPDRRHAGAGGNYDRAKAVGVDAAGNVYLAGTDYTSSATFDDALLLKYDAAGNLQWTFRWDSPMHRGESVSRLLVDAAGAWLLGSSYDTGLRSRAMALRVDPGGVLVSSTLLSGSVGGDVFADGAPGPASVYAVGYSLDGNSSGDVLVAQIGENGSVLWQEAWDSGGADLGLAVAAGPQALYVGGDTYSTSGSRLDLLAMRWNAATGLAFDVPPLQRGTFIAAQVSGAPPGSTVAFLMSRAGLGGGPCSAALGGACLDLLPPVTVLGTQLAGPQGQASLTVQVPPSVPLVTVYLQAAATGSPGLVSAPVTRTILP